MARQRFGPKEWTPLDGRHILIAELGDVHPLEYGGHLVYKVMDPGGIYYQSVKIEPMIDRGYEVRRWTIEKDVLADASWVDGDNLKDIASFIGSDMEALKKASVDPDARVRAWVYESIGDFFGFDNLDAYPTRVTKAEILELFPELAS